MDMEIGRKELRAVIVLLNLAKGDRHRALVEHGNLSVSDARMELYRTILLDRLLGVGRAGGGGEPPHTTPGPRAGQERPDLVQDRRDRLVAKRRRVAIELGLPERLGMGIGHPPDHTPTEARVRQEPWKIAERG